VTKRKRAARARTMRRALERRDDKLSEARRKLIRLSPGGAPERPCPIDSASVVELRAEGTACPDCAGALRCEEHVALAHGGELLRVAKLRCRVCGAPLELYFRVVEKLPN
jgi:hypothetical protein